MDLIELEGGESPRKRLPKAPKAKVIRERDAQNVLTGYWLVVLEGRELSRHLDKEEAYTAVGRNRVRPKKET